MRIAGNQPLVAATKDDALRMALEERRRETAYQGSTRLIDLKRLNKDPRFAKTVTHKNERKLILYQQMISGIFFHCHQMSWNSTLRYRCTTAKSSSKSNPKNKGTWTRRSPYKQAIQLMQVPKT
jgi:hypothetical protein